MVEGLDVLHDRGLQAQTSGSRSLGFLCGDEKRFGRILSRLQESDHLRPDINPELEATTLLCLFDGLRVQAAIEPRQLNAKRQRTILEGYFEKLVR